MTPLILAVLAAIITISGVQASTIHKVTVYQWNGEQCIGHTKGKPLHIKIDQCKATNAVSLKFEPDPRAKHNMWIDAINHARGQCYITAYPNGQCAEQGGVYEEQNWPMPTTIALPEHIGQCVSVPAGIRSIRFWCLPKIAIAESTKTEGFAYTSWTIINGTATPVPTSTSVVLSENYLTINPRDDAIVAPQAGRTIQPRAQSTGRPHGLIEHNYGGKHVWYMHPWAKVPLCFECWIPIRIYPDRFQCESAEDKRLSCSWPMPDGSTVTNTKILPQSTDIITRYITKRSTATLESNTSSVATESLEKRKQRILVSLTNPFVLGSRTCAKARWTREGKRDQKIVLTGPKSCLNRINDDIDPQPRHTTWVTDPVPPTMISTDVVGPMTAPVEDASNGTISIITRTVLDTVFVPKKSTLGVATTTPAFGRFYGSTTIGGVVYRIWPTHFMEE